MSDMNFTPGREQSEEACESRRAVNAQVVAPTLQRQSVVSPKERVQVTQQPPKQKRRIEASTPKFEWDLQLVPVLPDFYTLEQTAVFVPHTSPSVVSKRVSGMLWERSIETDYEDEKAKVKCVSPDGVDFRVRLFRGRGKFDHGIIVEIQRRNGTAFSYHSDAKAILNAAENKKVPPPPASFGVVSDDSESDGDRPDGSGLLVNVQKMFASPTVDAQNVGFQILVSSTDPKKMGKRTAVSLSKKLLEAENEVAAKVLSLVLEGREEDELYKFRTNAFTVLANVLQSAPSDCVTEELRERLKDVLITELEGANKNPRVAVQAARCVEKLLLQNSLFDADLHKALTIAMEAGAARHAGLKEQAQKCLEMYA